jgi:hypothetical protein
MTNKHVCIKARVVCNDQNRYFFYNVFFFPNSVNLTIINKLLLPVAIRLTDSLCYFLKLLAKFLYKLNITFTSILGYIRWPNIVLVTAVCFGIITIIKDLNRFTCYTTCPHCVITFCTWISQTWECFHTTFSYPT